jgi:hypothetical protein
VCWVRICFQIFSSTSSSWDNAQYIFQINWKFSDWVSPERDNKVFFMNQSIRVYFLKLFLESFWPLKCVSNLQNKKWLKTSKSVLKEYSNSKLWKDFMEFKNIVLKVKLSNKFKNGHQKFSTRKVLEKYHVVSFRRHSTRTYPLFLEYILRIISGPWRDGKNLKTDSDSTQH